MTDRPQLLHPRDEIVRTMERIYHYRMTTTSGGNLSLRETSGDIWVTPARVDKGTLRSDEIVCVAADGSVAGRHPPSSEFPFHRAIYEARPDLRGIVHAHSTALVAFSICRIVPDTRLFHQARRVCGEVGFAPYALPGSAALARNIADTFAKGFHCVLLENHGVVVGGDSLHDAFQRFETLEFTAKTIIKARTLGGLRYLSDEQLELPRRAFTPLPIGIGGEPSSREQELRQQLCAFLRRSYRNRLVISTEGSFSARVDADTFLITPRDRDRFSLKPSDVVLIRRGAAEPGKSASRAARIHQAIYAQHRDINAVVNAYAVNATAFAVTDAQLDARTIPESFLLLRDVQRIPYGLQFQDGQAIAERMSLDRPVALLESDGVLVCGTSVLDAFDRLEVLESTAETFINGRLLGQPQPMSDAVIAELTAAFLPKRAT